MKSTQKKFSGKMMILFLTLFMIVGASQIAFSATEGITQGTTIVADSTSPTGYSVTFVYYNPNAEQVKLAGDLTLLDSTTGGATRLQPEEWETGMYHSGGVEFLRDMTKDEKGNWSVTIPLHAGGLSYWYRVWDSSQEWENHRILDPTYKSNMSPDPFRVYNNNDVLGVVYVPYDEKQNDATLESRATYELPIEDLTKKGIVHFDPYTNVLGGTGYLGIYLPAGYDANRAEPYKVVYLAHGVFGDETDWMGAGNAPNILDNMIARGEIEPTIIVTMGNQINNGKYNYLDTDDQGAATNLVKYILPYMEANYNVSNKREDRAYGGFSGGAYTGVTILNKYHDEFGYYGLFSGMGTPDYTVIADENAPFVMTSNGSFEAKSTYDSMKNMHDNFIANGISSVYNIVPGAHDLMMAGQQFTFFAKNCLWK